MTQLPAPPVQDRNSAKEIALITVGLILGAILLVQAVLGVWSPLDLFR